MTALMLGNKAVGLEHPAYFVADISANHDGSLDRAKLLIRLCAEAANAKKFRISGAPEQIVSQRGFQKHGKCSFRTSPNGRRVSSRSTRTQLCLGNGLPS